MCKMKGTFYNQAIYFFTGTPAQVLLRKRFNNKLKPLYQLSINHDPTTRRMKTEKQLVYYNNNK